MPRKRMIDPGIWQSEQVGSLTRDQRLLFIGIFSNADDAGRVKGSGAYLRAVIFPYDEDLSSADVAEWRDRLVEVGLIRRYLVDTREYVDLPSWSKYQRIDKPSASLLPSFDECSESPIRRLVEPSPSIPSEVRVVEEKGIEVSLSPSGDAPTVAPLVKTSEISAQVAEVWAYYREQIQPKARICPESKIRTRLKRFTVADLKAAVDRFTARYWYVVKCSDKGGEWFFSDDSQIDKFLLAKPQSQQEYEAGEMRWSKNGQPEDFAMPSPPDFREALAKSGVHV